jgi:hypothetical protein
MKSFTPQSTTEQTSQSDVARVLVARKKNLPEGQVQRQPVQSGQHAPKTAAHTHHLGRIPIFSPTPARIQPKLKINEPGDPYEQEADAMSERVMRMESAPIPSVQRMTWPIQRQEEPEEEEPVQAKPLDIQRSCTGCEKEKEEERPVQTKPLMHKSAGGGYSASPHLSAQLSQSKGGGSPLPKPTLSFMNRAFGSDFSHVRVHAGSEAQEMSQGIQAKAFTHGSDIYFNRGQYSPESSEGKRLLGHELTHVVQQGSIVRRSSISPLVGAEQHSVEGEEERHLPTTLANKEEETDAHGGISVMPNGHYLQRQNAPPITQEQQACMAKVGPDKPECDPATISWSNFTAKPSGSSYSAVTFTDQRLRPINTARRQCIPAARREPSQGIQAYFEGAKSWVNLQFSQYTNPNLNGCKKNIKKCETFLKKHPNGKFYWAMSTLTNKKCPASAVPRGDKAYTVGECSTIVGKDCAERAAAESARLLRHEQGHVSLNCAMARKANAMLSKTPAPNVNDLLAATQIATRNAQAQYDSTSGTNHGCNSNQQATWETQISNGLPNIRIKVRLRRP